MAAEKIKPLSKADLEVLCDERVRVVFSEKDDVNKINVDYDADLKRVWVSFPNSKLPI